MNFNNIDKKYRPIPFWSWNEKLDTEETKRQVHLMNEAGMGGFFMHARGGLQTEYMSDEWFSNIDAAVKTANETGMKAWAYDENGWPSGFGNGLVNGLGIEYQQKYLRMSKEEPKENIICKNGEHWFYYEVNPYYVDVLDRNVIKKFIECTYEPYYEKFKNEIEGFFTDEPQISRKGIPWSFVFEEEYKVRYKESLFEHLEELFLKNADYKNTRIKFWKMVTDLFSESFMKQIYDWCDDRNLKFTGHLLLEESIFWQLTSNGACMPHYEYFHIPGMDWLGRDISDCLTAKQVSSVAQQLGKKQVVAETFALCGHNVSFKELKGIYEWQMVRGINILCQHLEGYSLRGIRKRDYPPAMYYQQPWWSVYDKFNDAVSREGMLLSEGKSKADVLLIHPQTTAWTMFDDTENKGIKELDEKFLNIIKELEKKHIEFHLGDETIIERHAKVENGKLIIGEQAYDKVITDSCEYLLPYTEKLLKEFTESGGKVVKTEEIEENKIIDDETITYTVRYFDDFTLHYFVNTSDKRKDCNITVKGEKIDIYSGDTLEFNGLHSFEPWGSLMVIEKETENRIENGKENYIELSGSFKVKEGTENSLTLDKCDYYFDGILQEKDGYVLNICERANSLERQVKIHQDYHIKVENIPEKINLVCETPEKFEISINGVKIDSEFSGYFRDKSFRKTDITGYIKQGENVISFDCDFVQNDKFYENLKKAKIFEGEKNKLSYDMEIEAIYLTGDFSVRTDGKWEELNEESVRYKGDFVIDKPVRMVTLKDIQKQGFPFFCGELSLEGEIEITEDSPTLFIDAKGINAVKIEIVDFEKTILTDDRVKLDVSKGKHKIKLTLINNLRNLLGPHHLEEGEIHCVAPGSFYKEDSIWSGWGDGKWNNGYCFVRTGIIL